MSGKKKTTTTSQSGPPSWAVPYYQDYYNRAADASKKPYQAYGGERNAGFTNDQLDAMDMTRHNAYQNQNAWAEGGNQLMEFAQGNRKNPYSGANNPYLEGMISNANKGITDNFNNVRMADTLKQFSSSGAFGGSAYQQALEQEQRSLADALARNETGARFNEYDIQRQLATQDLDRQQSAINQLPGYLNQGYYGANALMNMGNAQQQLQQNIYNTGYNDYLDERNWDANRLGLLGGALNTSAGNSSSSTGPNPNYQSPWQTAAGIAATAAAIYGGS